MAVVQLVVCPLARCVRTRAALAAGVEQAAGLAVVVISSYLPEIMNLSDRILVCRQGRVVEEISPAEATEEKIMFAAVH